MVAELQHITSLKRPPPGWNWDLEERDRRRQARTSDTLFHLPPTTDGPEPSATADLPHPARAFTAGERLDAWTSEQIWLLYDLAGMVPVDEIARRVGQIGPARTAVAIRAQAQLLGYSLEKRWKRLYKWSRWTDPEEAMLRELAGQVEPDEITRQLNARFGTMRRVEGIRQHMSKLELSVRIEGLIPQHRVLILLGVGKPRLVAWIAEGLLAEARASTGRGSDRLFRMDDLETFVRTHPEQLRGRRLSPGPLRDLAEASSRRGRWLTVQEAARIGGLHQDTVYKACKRGQVPGAVRVGRRYRIPLASVDGIRRRPSYCRSAAQHDGSR